MPLLANCRRKTWTKTIKLANRKNNCNISELERKALRQLKENINIIIKSADIGGVIVKQNTKDYVTEAVRQLNNSNFEEQLQHNPMDRYMRERDNLLNNALENKWLTKNQFECLINKYPVTPVFYLLLWQPGPKPSGLSTNRSRRAAIASA